MTCNSYMRTAHGHCTLTTECKPTDHPLIPEKSSEMYKDCPSAKLNNL